jgi:hypothetical protein
MVSAHLISKVTEEFKLELTASVEGSYSYALEPPLAIMTFPTIVVLVGGIPVTFTPEIYVNAGISGEVSAKVTTGVYQTASLTAGIEYKDGMWTDSITPDYTFEKTPLSVEAQAQVTAYAGPELRVKIWKEPSLIIDLRGNVSLMAEACEQEGQIIGITGEITAGAELILGLKFDKLSKLIADQTMTVWEPDSIVIYEFPECGEGAVCCTCTIPPDVGLFDVPLPYCLSVDQYNLEGCFPELTTFECGGTFFNTYNECLGGCFITP